MRRFLIKSVLPASLLVALILVVSLGLIACGGSNSGGSTTTLAGAETTVGATDTTGGGTVGSTDTTAAASTGTTIVEGATDWQAQLPQLEKAAQDNPTDLTALQALAVAQYNLKKYDEAAATYEKMLAIKDEPMTRNNYANVLRDAGKKDLAIAQYQKAIAGDPQLVVAYINLAVMYSTIGDLTNADKVLNQGIAATTGDDQTRLKAVKEKLDKPPVTTTTS